MTDPTRRCPRCRRLFLAADAGPVCAVCRREATPLHSPDSHDFRVVVDLEDMDLATEERLTSFTAKIMAAAIEHHPPGQYVIVRGGAG